MSFAHSFLDVRPPARFDATPWTKILVFQSTMPNGAWTLIDTIAIPLDATPETPNPLSVTTLMATIAAGYFDFAFLDATGVQSPTTGAVQSPRTDIPVPPTVLATVADLEARIGRTFTEGPQHDQAGALLDLASGLVLDAVARTEIETVSPALRTITIEAVVRVLQNPGGVRSQQETLGQFSHSETFAGGADTSGLYLTPAEERRARRAVFGLGAGSASPRVGAVVDDEFVRHRYSGPEYSDVVDISIVAALDADEFVQADDEGGET